MSASGSNDTGSTKVQIRAPGVSLDLESNLPGLEVKLLRQGHPYPAASGSGAPAPVHIPPLPAAAVLPQDLHIPLTQTQIQLMIRPKMMMNSKWSI